MEHTIFYSWQSDTRAAANRTLIQDSLELAIKALKGEEKATTVNPVVDRDTSGVAGSPDISATILNKIDNSSVVVADVTLVDQGTSARRFPNPNVLIEVGYAIKSLGFSRVLLVQNTFFGAVEALPFDLRGKRVLTYYSDPQSETRKKERIILVGQIKNALISILPILEDTVEVELLDISSIQQNIENIYNKKSGEAQKELSNIANQIISTKQTPPESKVHILNRIVDLWKTQDALSNEFLYDLSTQSVLIHPTSTGYFNIGFLAGKMGKRHDSISAYMKAIDLGDPNPSLCYLNAGNRFRDMNEYNMAISFYEKSIELNPRQINAVTALAQLYDQIGDINSAIKNYKIFLDLFSQRPLNARTTALIEQAKHAEHYVNFSKSL